MSLITHRTHIWTVVTDCDPIRFLDFGINDVAKFGFFVLP